MGIIVIWLVFNYINDILKQRVERALLIPQRVVTQQQGDATQRTQVA